MKVLITGSSGFIGKNVSEYISKYMLTHEIFIPTRNNIIDGIKYVQPDIIIHLAGNPIKTYSSEQLYRDNFELTQDVINATRVGTKLVFASSSVVYGNVDKIVDENDGLFPESVYAETKVAAENLCLNSARIKPLILRYITNLGKYSKYGVLWDMIHKLRSNEATLKLFGDRPGSTRPYMNVLDTAAITVEMALTDHAGIYNVSIEDEINIEMMSHFVQMELKASKPIAWLGEANNWKGDQRNLRVSNKKLLSVCPIDIQYNDTNSVIRKATQDIVRDL